MNYNGDLYLQERINKLKTDYYDFIAEIHLNAGGGTGTEVYYCHTDILLPHRRHRQEIRRGNRRTHQRSLRHPQSRRENQVKQQRQGLFRYYPRHQTDRGARGNRFHRHEN